MTNEELVQLYQSGDDTAMDKLVNQNAKIIFKIVNKFYFEATNSIDQEDLIQEGYIGLINAAKKYKPDIEHPCKFITYAVYWIYQKINRFMKFKNTNNETSLNIPVGDNSNTELQDFIKDVDYGFENVEEKLYLQQLRQELETVMYENNTLREREILKLHYGWNTDCMTFQEIGDLLRISKERTKQLSEKALRKLRYSKWGRIKGLEIYGHKRHSSMYSIPGTVESISFAQKYLFDDKVI